MFIQPFFLAGASQGTMTYGTTKWSFFSFLHFLRFCFRSVPPNALPAGSKALPADFVILSAALEVLSVTSAAFSATSEALSAASEALSAAS